MIASFRKATRVIAATYLITTFFSLPASAEPTPPPPPESAIIQQQPQALPHEPPTLLPSVEKLQQTTDASDMDRIDLRYIKGYATDTGKIVAAPLNWKANQWLKLGLVAGGTSALFLVDKDVTRFARKNQSTVASGFANVGDAIGEPLYIFPAVGASYLYGHFADDAKVRRASLLALESLAISGVLTLGIKTVAGRHRPLTGPASDVWEGFTGKNDENSFSSGHTANAFAVATVVADQYKNTPYVAPVAYSLATLTALARIYDNEHWASDTFFGAALGYFVSKAVLGLHKEKTNKHLKRVSLTPHVGSEMTGLTVNYKF